MAKAKTEIVEVVSTIKKKIVDKSVSRQNLALKLAFARCKRIAA